MESSTSIDAREGFTVSTFGPSVSILSHASPPIVPSTVSTVMGRGEVSAAMQTRTRLCQTHSESIFGSSSEGCNVTCSNREKVASLTRLPHRARVPCGAVAGAV